MKDEIKFLKERLEEFLDNNLEVDSFQIGNYKNSDLLVIKSILIEDSKKLSLIDFQLDLLNLFEEKFQYSYELIFDTENLELENIIEQINRNSQKSIKRKNSKVLV